jgi:flagellar biosynthesis/type III secretory pathway M-ring protein FliF/YscJ
MFWIWAWICLVVLVVVFLIGRAQVRRLKRLDEELRAETERFEAHRKKELWELEQKEEQEQRSHYD